jgi:hypothetical protein
MKFGKNLILNIIGVFFVVLGLITIVYFLFTKPVNIFWFCNHAVLFMGIAILFRKSFLLFAEFLLLFFGQFIWILMYLAYVIFGFITPGALIYLDYGVGFFDIVALIVHLFTIPFGFVAILILGKKEKFAWSGSFVHALMLIPFIFYFGEEFNVNCFLRSCIDWIPNVFLYPIWIFVFYFGVIVGLNYLINVIVDWYIKRL